MSRLTGNYKEGAFANVADADAGLDSWITAMDTRFQAIAGGDLATRAYGTFTLNVKCEDGASNIYTFKMSITFDTGTVAVGAPDANCQTVVTNLAALATAAEGASAYTTVVEVEVNGSLTIED
jgi:hypothetical protein